MINGFEYPYFLLLLVIIPLLIAFQIFYDKKQYSNIHYSQLTPFEGYSKSWRVKLRLLPNYLRYLVLALLIIAIARPQSYLSKDEMNIEGVDIVVALDISGSMLAEDFKPNRLEAAKDVGRLMSHDMIVVDKSTVPVGTADNVKNTINKELKKRDVNYKVNMVSNPEFLKEGAAVENFMRPDRVVIGSDDEEVTETMRELYAPFIRNHERFMTMNIDSADMAKYAAHAMLAKCRCRYQQS